MFQVGSFICGQASSQFGYGSSRIDGCYSERRGALRIIDGIKNLRDCGSAFSIRWPRTMLSHVNRPPFYLSLLPDACDAPLSTTHLDGHILVPRIDVRPRRCFFVGGTTGRMVGSGSDLTNEVRSFHICASIDGRMNRATGYHSISCPCNGKRGGADRACLSAAFLSSETIKLHTEFGNLRAGCA